MTQTNPTAKKPSGTRNLKLLFTTLSLTSTLSGWALLSLNQAQALKESAPTDQAVADVQPTAVPTEAPAPVTVIIPPLSALPVRGLPEVGDPVYQPPPQIAVAVPQRQQGGPAPAQRPAASAPRPKPVANTGGSH